MNRKSETCFGKQTKEPLTEYISKDEAQKSADYINQINNINLTPYKCKNCDFWHLAPKDRQTFSKKCNFCKDSSGNRKDLYLSEEDAKRRLDIISEEKGISLKIYKCPYGDGYHLTKKNFR